MLQNPVSVVPLEELSLWNAPVSVPAVNPKCTVLVFYTSCSCDVNFLYVPK